MSNRVLVNEIELRELIYRKLSKAGYPKEQALEITNHLVYADSIGLESHGSLRTLYNISKLEKKGVNINPHFEFEENSPCSAILDGQNANGLFAVNKAIEYGILKAKEKGIFLLSIKNITHSGCMSYYVKKAAENDLIAISMCSSNAQVLPPNGKEPYFGTNPIAYAIPTKEDPIIFDMATSVQAFGKIYLASVNNESIPEGWAVDSQGNPTTDSNKASYVLPVGGHKGFGLAMLVDVLSAILTNLPFGTNIPDFNKAIDSESKLGQFFILINPDIYSSLDTFLTNMSKMVEDLHNIEPYDINEPVVVPGEKSRKRYLNNQKQGIPISKKVYNYLKE